MHSPCGIHAFPRSVGACPICERVRATPVEIEAPREFVRGHGRGRPAALVEHDGERRTVRDWLRLCGAEGVEPHHVGARMAVGWDFGRAIAVPLARRVS